LRNMRHERPRASLATATWSGASRVEHDPRPEPHHLAVPVDGRTLHVVETDGDLVALWLDGEGRFLAWTDVGEV
jgi:hypothetical protein